MKTSDFYYDLPQDLIAQSPLDRRDDSRLLHLNPYTNEVRHQHFFDLPKYLKEGDVLVLNETRVMPARLLGIKEESQIPCEVLLLTRIDTYRWECLVKPGRRLKVGTKIIFVPGILTATIEEVRENGNRVVCFQFTGIWEEILEQVGKMPLPPYIHAYLEDKERYQTVYAKIRGSAAAPTAGLHFTEDLLKKLEEQGVKIVKLCLHVGLGTFRPVQVDDVLKHKMHAEYFELTEEATKIINLALKEKRPVYAVGTTTTRVLETQARENEEGIFVEAGCGYTDIFLFPGKRIKVISGLITNFHLPESTLIMLVACLAGKDCILQTYAEAVRKKYRFFSFGDAMFIQGNMSKLEN